jgi:short-subunit dehydrogenase
VERLRGLTADVPIGVLVNNAGIGCGGAFATRDPARIARLVKLNCLAPAMLVRAYLPDMLERGAGAIVMVSSLQAFLSSPFEAAYCASKAFDLHFGESLWGELRGTPVDVITVCPAGMRTDFFKAEGFSKEDCDRMWRVSSSPEAVAAMTLRKLGRKPTVAPAVTRCAGFLARLLPRRWVIHLSDLVTRRLVRMDRALPRGGEAPY